MSDETPGTVLDAWVPGYPRPKGSLQAAISHGRGEGAQPCPHCGRPLNIYMHEAVKDSARWKRLVINGVRYQVGQRAPQTGPLEVSLTFYFDTPPRAADERNGPIKRPYGDIDKLTRNVLDALTEALVWGDDSQVVRVVAVKHWAPAGYVAGVDIKVRRAEW